MSLTTPASAPAPTVPRWINRIVIWLLRSPFHPLMSRTTMLLTFTGRQSGRRYTIPVRYLREEGDTLITTTDSRWWRNLQGGAQVKVHLAGHEVSGRAAVSTNPEDVEQGIIAILRRMPYDARFYQIQLDRHGQPNMVSLKQAAQANVLITVNIGSHAETHHRFIEPIPLDLASLSSIRTFAQEIPTHSLPPLHALVCNAGLQIIDGTQYTTDGFEMTFGVNHLGHFLLVNLLLRSLVPPARIVFVSSDTHDPRQRTGMPAPQYRDPTLLAWPEKDSRPPKAKERADHIGRIRYTTSKLCNLLCTYELARRLEERGDQSPERSLTVNAFNPGLMPGTGLARNYPPLLGFLFTRAIPHLIPLIRRFGLNANTASTSGQHLARLILDPTLENLTGKYFSGLTEIPSSEESYDRQKATELWERSAELVELQSTETFLPLASPQ